MPIQKEGGCNFMDCPNCRRHFCWSCGRVLKGSHQAHKCDAGIEGSKVMSKSPNGQPCVEFTRLFTNVLDIDSIDLLNCDEVDLADLREMLVPGLSEEARTPLFVGPSECDGEVVLRLPFNFRKVMSWEISHILLRASHPPAPNCFPPRVAAVLPNVEGVSFQDFDDASVLTIQLTELGGGVFVIPFEQFRAKGTFRRVTSLAIKLALAPPDGEAMEDDAQLFFNDMALFGLPGDVAAGGPSRRNAMYDERANLIVSPVLKSRWGHHSDEGEGEEADRDGAGDDGDDAEKAGESAVSASPEGEDGQRRAGLSCANEGCQYLADDGDACGGFCCAACSRAAASTTHDRGCQRRIAPFGAPRAKPNWRAAKAAEASDARGSKDVAEVRQES